MNTILLTLNNFLLEITTHHFLAIFAAVILTLTLVLLLWSRYLRKVYYQKALEKEIKISTPLQIAYLKNGIQGYIRNVLFKLIQENYLEVPRKGWFGYKVRSKAGHPSLKKLSKEEQIVYHYAVQKEYWEKILRHKELQEDLKLHLEDIDIQLTDYSLLYPRRIVNRMYKLRAFFMLLVLSLGSYRYLMSFEKVRTNAWSIVLAGLVGLMLITHVARLDRVTKQGQKYLDTLKKNYKTLNPGKSNQYQLVTVSLFRNNKKAMEPIVKFLKAKQKTKQAWSDLTHTYIKVPSPSTS